MDSFITGNVFALSREHDVNDTLCLQYFNTFCIRNERVVRE
jgi:hypothetical protein